MMRVKTAAHPVLAEPASPMSAISIMEPLPKRTTIRDQVVERITELIVSGDLPAGTRLTELGVADMLGVSRVPVREAFLILQGDEWIDIQTSQGAQVHVPLPHEVKDIFEVRMSLESEAALLTADRHGDITGELLTLAQTGKRIASERGVSNNDELSDLNERFHDHIARQSDNPILAKIVRLMALKTQMYFTVNIADPRGPDAWDEHVAIAQAIALRQGEHASRLMREHVKASWHHFEETKPSLD